VFQKHYSKMLAKRLVFNSSASADSEAGMIQRLGVACGLEYTQRLSRMFKDMATSAELTHAFMESRFYESGEYEFNANVLTSGSWPLTTSKSSFVLSRELAITRDAFTQFYLAKHNGRRLNWEGQYSKVDVRVRIGGKGYEINMGLFVYGVLDYAFNSGSGRNQVKDVVVGCGLETAEVLRIIKSLEDVGLVIVEDGGWFNLNEGFSHKKVKFKIAAGGGGKEIETKESAETRKAVIEDRKLYLQVLTVLNIDCLGCYCENYEIETEVESYTFDWRGY
jgi:cullin 1